ncbi:putative 1-acyl-sn-glycerol-3-phosphate acyltransferase alpha [Necator americanus]|uniref:1-acyl-sn-glycerol-3-phosphate acyltransferase n=1 Tax=Necator americanus TaxID=51031 RepID=W2TKR8_NECAM|nr:putative 1-acyl-sn-glycerol-3-phosphate acyltransferase alpha [Necator americanus]ETN82373.1 putative 1-acyl-sn-glycerol-3-phosphate acyltransferase alpha [Necator americanus]
MILLLVVLPFLAILYNISQQFHYFTRITFFYICIFFHGIECCITMIPSWIAGKGADVIFHTFKNWTLWTGINMEVRGFDEHLKNLEGPAVVICNHQSAVDVVAMTRVWPPRGTVMMKKSLKYIPFFNFTSFLGNAIFVDRFRHDKAMAQVEYCVEELKKRNLKIWIFPEGTRNHGSGLLPFKKGAFNIAVMGQFPIVPIVLSNYEPFYSKRNRYFKSDGEVIAKVLSPVSTKGLSVDDVPELLEKVRNRMLEVLTDISQEAAERMKRKRQCTT